MKGNFPKLFLAILIAIAVFAALRAREFVPAAPSGTNTGSTSQASHETVAQASRPATSTLPAKQAEAKVPVQPITREPASLRSPTELFTELFRRGEWSVSRGVDGRLTGLQGTPIQGATADAKSALAFARKLVQQVGANPEQLSEAHSKADTEQGLQTMYKYEQWVGDHPVFGANLSVFSRRVDSAAYLVNSSLKPIDDTPPPGISRAQAQALVLDYYKDRGGKISTPVFMDEYIFADQAPTEFAWYFMVDVASPAQNKLKVLFGATTRRVLYEKSALIN